MLIQLISHPKEKIHLMISLFLYITIFFHSEKIFLSYSPHGLRITKNELLSDKDYIEKLLLDMSDPIGVLLDQNAATPYCNTPVELCASVGNWADPNDLYVADDGVIRFVLQVQFSFG